MKPTLQAFQRACWLETPRHLPLTTIAIKQRHIRAWHFSACLGDTRWPRFTLLHHSVHHRVGVYPLRHQTWQQPKFGTCAQQCSLVETPNGRDKKFRTWQADSFIVADISHTMTAFVFFALHAYITWTVWQRWPTNQSLINFSNQFLFPRPRTVAIVYAFATLWMGSGECSIQSRHASEQGNNAHASASFDHILTTHWLLFTARILKCTPSAMHAPYAPALLDCTGYDMATLLQCWGTEGALLHITSSLFISQRTLGIFNRHDEQRTPRSVSDNCMSSSCTGSHKTIKTSLQWKLWFSLPTL